jgi:hypothetical protein
MTTWAVCRLRLTRPPIASTTVAQVGRKVVTGLAAVGTWGTSPCRLHSRLTFSVKRFAYRVSPGGAVRRIKGNPAVAIVDSVLRPGAVVVASWRWRNSCGRSGHFQLQASFNRWPYLAVPSHGFAPPRCTSREEPSTLARAAVGVRRCSTRDYRVHPAVGGGFMESLILGVGIELRAHHAPCLLAHASVTLALQHQVSGRWVKLDRSRGTRATGQSVRCWPHSVGRHRFSGRGGTGVVGAATSDCSLVSTNAPQRDRSLRNPSPARIRTLAQR